MPIDDNNPLRIQSARLALDAYRRAKHGTHAVEDEADARDLITDIMHLINAEMDEHNAVDEAKTAIANFRDEV